MPRMLVAAKPEGTELILHSDMRWQCQHAACAKAFGHMKDEFFRGRSWGGFDSFKSYLEPRIEHWNAQRRQVKPKGLTPEEFRNQALRGAA